MKGCSIPLLEIIYKKFMFTAPLSCDELRANRKASRVVKLYCYVVNFHKQQRIYDPALEGEKEEGGREGERGRGREGKGGAGHRQAPSYRGQRECRVQQ